MAIAMRGAAECFHTAVECLHTAVVIPHAVVPHSSIRTRSFRIRRSACIISHSSFLEIIGL
ncbi:MAG: hypothetical protein JWM26_3489 [Betaproteobacteria bacterium]|nr:hypothetical protein [Betaproteobacteria bacterium]